MASTVEDMVAAILARLEAQVPTGPVLVIPAPPTDTEMVAWCRCWNQYGQLEENVLIEAQLLAVPTSLGDAYDDSIATALSNSDGIASLILPRGKDFKFRVRRNGGTWKNFSGDDVASMELPDMIGRGTPKQGLTTDDGYSDLTT